MHVSIDSPGDRKALFIQLLKSILLYFLAFTHRKLSAILVFVEGRSVIV